MVLPTRFRFSDWWINPLKTVAATTQFAEGLLKWKEDTGDYLGSYAFTRGTYQSYTELYRQIPNLLSLVGEILKHKVRSTRNALERVRIEEFGDKQKSNGHLVFGDGKASRPRRCTAAHDRIFIRPLMILEASLSDAFRACCFCLRKSFENQWS